MSVPDIVARAMTDNLTNENDCLCDHTCIVEIGERIEINVSQHEVGENQANTFTDARNGLRDRTQHSSERRRDSGSTCLESRPECVEAQFSHRREHHTQAYKRNDVKVHQ
jgi:hypothetical protein